MIKKARLVRRIVVTTAGGAVLGIGALLVPLPGPGLLVVSLGVFILSFEYEWARQRIEVVLRQAEDLVAALREVSAVQPASR